MNTTPGKKPVVRKNVVRKEEVEREAGRERR